MEDKTMATLIVTIVIAIIGFVVKYVNDVAVARRKDKLERVNLQLKNLYGPLYAMSESSKIAWKKFRSKYRPTGSFFGTSTPPSLEDLKAWRLWMSEVFMPLNLKKEKTIVENGDLIIEKEMPQCFIEFCAHVAAYKPVIKKWESGDYSEYLSANNFPVEFDKYVKKSYETLKDEQSNLLNSLKII